MSVPDPRTAPALRWGVLGPGGIAAVFTECLHEHTASRVVAVGSRDHARATAFAERFGVPAAYSSYEDVCTDDSVEAVYVATPHSHHLEQALLAVEAGKPVLVEKAFTRNRAEAERLFEAARERGVFAMEAMWTRFLPQTAALHDIVAAGELGTVFSVSADHGQGFPFDPRGRLFDPALAGGALLDLGVYCVAFAHDVLGAPDEVHAHGTLTDTGVDDQVAMVLTYPDHVQAVLHTTLKGFTPNVASVSGSAGHVALHRRFYAPTTMTVSPRGGEIRTYDFTEPKGKGLQYEAAEVARCVAAGLLESPRMTWQHTLDVLSTLDAARAQVGVVYPGE